METEDDIFSRIESSRDSLGNIFTHGESVNKALNNLRVGDTIEFVITASDPQGASLEYGMTVTGHHHNPKWQSANTFTLTLANSHIGKHFGVMFWVKSPRQFHANQGYDDSFTFIYNVFPSQS